MLLRCRLLGSARRFGAHGGEEGRGMAAARLQLVPILLATQNCSARETGLKTNKKLS